ncbi:protein-L-isoaspartate(D-aspartate) O-methyltransferase [Portibacter marinus]|uniref:protein-L-isoaspartate(D-aspartate) O-methyltransferase n=1 Tax=Portibacter marinus TaxID=2898660 RepID=UPI001F42CC41|nr:protein-L-isoaspartate(D-aspartate) O-methyltransferase [Portibacter marinus]
MNAAYTSKRKRKTLEDSYRHKGMRMKLVGELRKKGITDKAALAAIADIPRHFFLDKAFEEWAYKDVPFPIESNQTISQPYTVAFQTSLLNIEKGDKVLEIGTGSGYQACVLAHMGAKVYSIERQQKLYQITNQFLPRIGYGNIRLLLGDGYMGSQRFAPFDKILVTAGASYVPDALIQQLKVDGVLVIPVGDDIQKMLRITKVSEDEVKTENFGDFRFVPFLKGIN